MYIIVFCNKCYRIFIPSCVFFLSFLLLTRPTYSFSKPSIPYFMETCRAVLYELCNMIYNFILIFNFQFPFFKIIMLFIKGVKNNFIKFFFKTCFFFLLRWCYVLTDISFKKKCLSLSVLLYESLYLQIVIYSL